MKHKTLRFGRGFKVVLGNQCSQAAEIPPPSGATEDVQPLKRQELPLFDALLDS